MRRWVILSGVLALPLLCRLGSASEPTIDWQLRPSITGPAKTEVARGDILFQQACAICHGKGIDRPGTSSLAIKYGGKEPALLEQRTDLTSEYVLYIIRHGIAMMPPFRKTELNDAQAAAIAAYLSRGKRSP